MTETEQIKEAYDAITYVLRRIRHEPELAWYFEMTEAKAKLEGAFAAITDKPVESVREYFRAKETRDPRTLTTDQIPDGYKLVPIEDDDIGVTHVDWPARDHETFFWPVHLLNEALAAYGVSIEYQPAARAGYYEVVIGGVR